jgi:D-threo-aldose 1-dehydrogenase
VEVTELGFGAAPIGNLYREVSAAEARDAVDAAWAAGVRYFDTAPHYGLGLSERRLGAALADRPRAEYVLSTKVGRLLRPQPGGGPDPAGFVVPATHRRVWDFSADGVRRSLASSLERLGLDRIDVVLLHDPDEHWAQAVSQAYPALARLRDEGVVGAIGVGMNQWQMPARFVRETDLDVVLLAGRYTLLEQPAADELLPLCAERGVSVLAAGVFNSGLLARPEVPQDATYDYAPAPAGLLAKARRIAAVCRRHGTSLPRAAAWFPLGHPAVASVVLGTHHAAQVTENAGLFAEPLPAELWADLRAEGLLRADVPVPTGVSS